MEEHFADPRQLPLDLACRPAFGEEDFFLSKSNETAVKMIDEWPDWGQYGRVLVGPPASGKSHLANVWKLRSNALIVRAAQLDLQYLEKIPPDRNVCIEDLHQGLAGEEALFHLLNRARERRGAVLLTSRIVISKLNIALKDLRSRLLALPAISIEAPDDQLLMAVMVKQFADRQMEVEPRLISYLFKRSERSMQAVTQMVEDLDRMSLGEQRRITTRLAREYLAAYNREHKD